MPEGPSIVIARDAMISFKGKKITNVSGNTKVDVSILKNNTITGIKSWGKHLLICFKSFTVRIHFMMFGSYRINDSKKSMPRLSLEFKDGVLNFYTCSVKIINEPLDEVYDWSADVLNPAWSMRKAKNKLKLLPEELVCDVLLDQQIFSGVGNIIKNEVLFRIQVHPLSKVGKLPAKQLNSLVKDAVDYSFQFLEWKKAFVLRKHWQAYAKKICPRNKIPFHKEYPGKTKRRTFFCNKCQKLYE